jgi:NitT/TauT family transport system substrate-binding protein
MSTDFIKNQADVARALLRAIMRSQRSYLQGDYHVDPNVLPALAKQTGVPEDSITSAPSLVFTKDLQPSQSTIKAETDSQSVWLMARNVLQYTQPLPLERIQDLSLATAVAAGN